MSLRRWCWSGLARDINPFESVVELHGRFGSLADIVLTLALGDAG